MSVRAAAGPSVSQLPRRVQRHQPGRACIPRAVVRDPSSHRLLSRQDRAERVPVRSPARKMSKRPLETPEPSACSGGCAGGRAVAGDEEAGALAPSSASGRTPRTSSYPDPAARRSCRTPPAGCSIARRSSAGCSRRRVASKTYKRTNIRRPLVSAFGSPQAFDPCSVSTLRSTRCPLSAKSSLSAVSNTTTPTFLFFIRLRHFFYLPLCFYQPLLV